MTVKEWWRANAVWLGILVVLIPAGTLIIGWRDWSEATTNPLDRTNFVEAPEDEPLEFANASWGPIRSAVIDDTSGMTPPPNTKVIAVAIPVVPDPEHPVQCDRPVLVQQSTGVQWNEMSYELGLDVGIGDNLSCSFDATEHYEMVVPFVVPEDVDGPFWVDIAPSERLVFEEGSDVGVFDDTGIDGRFVRFSIDP